MIILFGLRSRVKLLATLSLACRNGHVAAHRIARRTRWFTLFFVPVIPLSTKYNSVCIQCGLTLEIPKPIAEEMATSASMSVPQRGPAVPPLPPVPLAS